MTNLDDYTVSTFDLKCMEADKRAYESNIAMFDEYVELLKQAVHGDEFEAIEPLCSAVVNVVTQLTSQNYTGPEDETFAFIHSRNSKSDSEK
ncbi:hypothetical protein [Bifidobacterium olomucense]|uniref:Uncharacterized protein n=1 Tax=Bifidobacterium olomucense TaxID=2675324 RepID=A0A7Y0HX92_9BIFI|nr:hypothetical protein [Bifidobacterium sp. DSM 109959]NMM98087.1 hypothetical protein [Bifidobacterium sp. DSM 109959]